MAPEESSKMDVLEEWTTTTTTRHCISSSNNQAGKHNQGSFEFTSQCSNEHPNHTLSCQNCCIQQEYHSINVRQRQQRGPRNHQAINQATRVKRKSKQNAHEQRGPPRSFSRTDKIQMQVQIHWRANSRAATKGAQIFLLIGLITLNVILIRLPTTTSAQQIHTDGPSQISSSAATASAASENDSAASASATSNGFATHSSSSEPRSEADSAGASSSQPSYVPTSAASNTAPSVAASSSSSSSSLSSSSSCFGGLQTFEKISMSSFENPAGLGGSGSSSNGGFGSGILVQQDDQALTSECINLCRSQSNCLSFVIDYNKFECKSYATTQQELQQEFASKFQRQAPSGLSNETLATDGYQQQAASSNLNMQQLLPSASSNYFEKICLDGVANRQQFGDVCGPGRLWTIERVVDSFLDGFVEKEVTNVNGKDECSKLCIFEAQFVCRSADYDQQSRLCRLSKEDRRTQPQAMRHAPNSQRQYLENQCATPGPSSCVYETRRNVGIISMDALKFAQTAQDCQMKCNQEATFNCRAYSFHQQRCFLSGDDSVSLNSNLIKLPVKQGWTFGEKKCLVELCSKGIFSYEKITGYTLRSALSTSIDLMMPGASSPGGHFSDGLLSEESATIQRRSGAAATSAGGGGGDSTSNQSRMVSTMMNMMMSAIDVQQQQHQQISEPLLVSGSGDSPALRRARTTPSGSSSNLAITEHCRHSCDLGYLNCPAFTIDYRNNRCQRLDRNSQGRHHELVARDAFAYYEKICLRVPEIMSMCQDKYWIFERVLGHELAPRLYDKTLKFVQSRRDCQEYCLEEKQFQCRSALYNDETSDCKLSRYDRRQAQLEGGYYRNFNARISYLENNCVRDHDSAGQQQCAYEQIKDEPAYPTFTERIEMVPANATGAHSSASLLSASYANIPSPAPERDESMPNRPATSTIAHRTGPAYCEQLCNDNAKFECHSFGYYASTAQCFLSGEDSISAGEMATTPSSGFAYFERKCRVRPGSMNETAPPSLPPPSGEPYDARIPQTSPPSSVSATSTQAPPNPYLQPPPGSPSSPTSSVPMLPQPAVTDTPAGRPNKPTPGITTVQPPQMHVRPPVFIPGLQAPSMATVNPNSIMDQMSNNNSAAIEPAADGYKCGVGHTFVYQRISGFEPIGGYLTLLVKNNEEPGIVATCSDMCRRAFECRAFVVDYASNQCYAMLENSSVGLLSLRQTLGKDYFEGFCLPNHLLLTGSSCRQKTWLVDKIVDQAAIGVQHQKLLQNSDRASCRQACFEERLFWCKSAMFDGTTGECKLYSIDRESVPQMRLLFTKGVDFFENQCQITSSTCPYDAIERDMTHITVTKSLQARSTFDCELACNAELSFNCRSYTYLDQYPSLPNLCLLSSDSRSTSQRGSIKEHAKSLYAERNCYYRRPRFPSAATSSPGGDHQAPSLPPNRYYQPYNHHQRPASDPSYSAAAPPPPPSTESNGAYAPPSRGTSPLTVGEPHEPPLMNDLPYAPMAPMPPRLSAHTEREHASSGLELHNNNNNNNNNDALGPALGQASCEPHQFTFERTFGYDFRLAPKERARIAPTIGIAIGCQQECLRRADRCQAFVIDYALPYQSCFLLDTQVGSNKRLLVRAPNSAYFEKVCLPRTGLNLDTPPSDTSIASHSAYSTVPQSLGAGGGDISPSYAHEPWTPQPSSAPPPPLAYHLQQQQLVQQYPSRACAKLWSFERFVNHNFTAPVDKLIESMLSRSQCETACINEASFACRSATYDYANKLCRLFKSTRRTLLSQFVDLEAPANGDASLSASSSTQLANSHPGTAHVITTSATTTGGHHQAASEPQSVIQDAIQPAASDSGAARQRSGPRQLGGAGGGGAIQQQAVTADPSNAARNIDYLENTCTPEPSSCQYRQIYDHFSAFIDKVIHATSLGDCQRQCDQERLFSCKSVNYDPTTRNCMLVNEDLISLSRGQPQLQAAHQLAADAQHSGLLLPKKGAIYSEKGNCEMISVQCNSQEMLVSVNFDAPFRGRIMAKGNPEQCFMLGDGQTNVQFSIVFGPKCNSRQEGHNTFVNELLIQQHPVIMTESDKSVRVMCAFEAPDQTITLKTPGSRDNRTAGIDVAGTPLESGTGGMTGGTGRTRNDKQHFSSVVSSKAPPPSVVLRILDRDGRDASMINLGDELTLRIQMHSTEQSQHSSALGIFARNLAARSSNGESLLLIDNDGCPVDPAVFPALEVDARDSKSLQSNFKAFRFPSSGLVNFEVQIRFCPERCQPVDCQRGAQRLRSFGRKKRDVTLAESSDFSVSQGTDSIGRLAILQSNSPGISNGSATISDGRSTNDDFKNLFNPPQLSGTVMRPGKAFEYVRKLMLAPQADSESVRPKEIFNDQPANNGGQNEAASATITEDASTLATDEFERGNTAPIVAANNEEQQGSPPAYSQPEPASNFESAPVATSSQTGSITVDENTAPGAEQATLFANTIQANHQQSTQGGPFESMLTRAQAHNTYQQHQQPPPYGRFPIQSDVDVQQIFSRQRQQDLTTTTTTTATNSAGAASTTQPSDVINEKGNYDPATTDQAINADDQATPSSPWRPLGAPSNAHDASGSTLAGSSNNNSKDMPLRFSILVGENQANGALDAADPLAQPTGGSAPVLVMNSSNVDLDHIVIPGNEAGLANDLASRQPDEQAPPIESATSKSSKRNASYEQTFDAAPSNSIASQINQQEQQQAAASHDCQIESGRSKLKTIIWTGTIVIALNICLVVLSLVLYFKRVHLRHDSHTIVSSSSDCGTQLSSNGGGGGGLVGRRSRWPSVILKSKNSLVAGGSGAGRTSLSTHEHFFCKLNSNKQAHLHTDYSDFNWPNLSTNCSHSTVSSLANAGAPPSPIPSSLRQTHMRPSLKSVPFDAHSSLREGNFVGTAHQQHQLETHKTILDVNSSRHPADKYNARYTSNIDSDAEDVHANQRF